MHCRCMLRVLAPRSICTAGHGKGLKEAAMGAGPLPPVALPMMARSTCDGQVSGFALGRI